MVDRALVLPPHSRIGAITPAERAARIAASPIKGHYEQTVDRESAYERLSGRVEAPRSEAPAAPTRGTGSWERPGGLARAPRDQAEAPSAPTRRTAAREERGTVERIILGDGRRQGLAEAMAKSMVRQIGSSVGRQILRGVLGSILKG
jgi:hypothetical protein